MHNELQAGGSDGPPSVGAEAAWPAMAHDAVWAQERERQRIAAGLHDDIGQTLAMVGFKLGELGQRLRQWPARAGGTPHAEAPDAAAREAGAAALALVAELRALVDQAARATRSATFELACPLLEPLGLVAALQSLAARISQPGGLQVGVQAPPDWPLLPAPLPGVVYRVVRELLLNVQKHARAQQATVRLVIGPALLQVEVQDDGRGFDTSTGALRRFTPQGGYGLVSALAQIQAIGGRLRLNSAPGQGSCATVELPVRPITERRRAQDAALLRQERVLR